MYTQSEGKAIAAAAARAAVRTTPHLPRHLATIFELQRAAGNHAVVYLLRHTDMGQQASAPRITREVPDKTNEPALVVQRLEWPHVKKSLEKQLTAQQWKTYGANQSLTYHYIPRGAPSSSSGRNNPAKRRHKPPKLLSIYTTNIRKKRRIMDSKLQAIRWICTVLKEQLKATEVQGFQPLQGTVWIACNEEGKNADLRKMIKPGTNVSGLVSQLKKCKAKSGPKNPKNVRYERHLKEVQKLLESPPSDLESLLNMPVAAVPAGEIATLHAERRIQESTPKGFSPVRTVGTMRPCAVCFMHLTKGMTEQAIRDWAAFPGPFWVSQAANQGFPPAGTKEDSLDSAAKDYVGEVTRVVGLKGGTYVTDVPVNNTVTTGYGTDSEGEDDHGAAQQSASDSEEDEGAMTD